MTLAKLLPHATRQSGAENILRLAILGGPTTVQLRRLIEVFLAGEGIAAEIYECDYGLYRHEILAPGSELDLFQPTVVFLAVGARDVNRLPAIDADQETAAQLADEEVSGWAHLWETINSKWNAIVIQNNFEISPGTVLGHYALRHPGAREHYLERLNRAMAECAPAYVLLHDLRWLAAEAGVKSWFDPRSILSSRCRAERNVLFPMLTAL
jgi:predicted enzyme involved in methoxymalonyl-ACP biosynthesis